jgi:hypothetical protein
MTEPTFLADALRKLIAQHGMVAMLQALANVMADQGNVTGGTVSEIAAIEEWLEAQYNLRPRPPAE